MSFRPIYEGWDVPGRLSRSIRRTFSGIGLNQDVGKAHRLTLSVADKLRAHSVDTTEGHRAFAEAVVQYALSANAEPDPENAGAIIHH